MNKIINEIKKRSAMPIENKIMLKKYLNDSKVKNIPIIFYNWECPPRFLDEYQKGKFLVNYDIDLKKIFNGQVFDKYTEIPRVVKDYKKELRILEYLKNLGINFIYIKIIADTNFSFITPESSSILNKTKTKNIFNKFKNMVQERLDKYYYDYETKAYLFTDLIKNYKKEYENNYFKALELLENGKLVSNEILENQTRRTEKHMGLAKKDTLIFSKRTIATYAAEGMIFDEISKEGLNFVWLNIEEADKRTIEITNCLRKRNYIGKLPIIFPK